MKCSVPNVSWRAVAGAHPYLQAHGHAGTHIHRGTKKTGRLPVLGALWEQMRGQDEGLAFGSAVSLPWRIQGVRAGPRPRAGLTGRAELR